MIDDGKRRGEKGMVGSKAQHLYIKVYMMMKSFPFTLGRGVVNGSGHSFL